MAGDDPVTGLYIGRHLGVSQQLKFRGALSVKTHAHKILQYGHGISRQNADKYYNEFYVKSRQNALVFPTFFHTYPDNQRLWVSRSKRAKRRGFGPLSHLPNGGFYCIATTILLSNVPTTAQGLRHGF